MSIPIGTRDLEVAREDVIQALGVHFANEDLSVEDLDQRLTVAIRARSHEQLNDLLADLPRLPDHARGASALSRQQVLTSDNVQERGFVGAFMGGTTRKGPWLVPRHVKAVAIMGGVELDLRNARFAPGVTEIEVYALMGGVDVIVPHGVRVEAMGMAVMGGFEASAGDIRANHPDQPVIRLSGFAAMGGVSARHKEPNTKALAKFEKRLKAAMATSRGER